MKGSGVEERDHGSVADPEQFHADPEHTFYIDSDPDHTFHIGADLDPNFTY